MVAGGGLSGGVWGFKWWRVGVQVVACRGSSGGVRELEWWRMEWSGDYRANITTVHCTAE